MDFALFTMQSRAGDALIALIAMIFTQLVMMGISAFTKTSMPVTPLIEIILRPLAVGMIDRLNRAGRTDFALIIRGVLTFMVLAMATYAIIYAVMWAMRQISMPYFIDIILLMLILSPIAVIMPALGISADKTKDGQYRAISIALNQNLVTSDAFGLRRVAYKSLTTALIYFTILPIIIYVIAGIEWAFIAVIACFMVRVSGQTHRAFLSIFLWMHHMIYGLADMIGAVFIALASIFTAGGRPLKSFKGFRTIGYMAESVFAHTQSITLGGAGQDRKGISIQMPWFGADGSTAKLSHQDVIRGCIHYGITMFLSVVAMFAFYAYATAI